MSDNPAGDEAREERFNRIIADYDRAVTAGRSPDRQALLAHFQDMRRELAEYFEAHDRIAQVVGPLRALLAGRGEFGQTVAPAADTPPLALPANEGIGAVRLPGYEILGELGRGGMGVVYKARQLKLNRLVALKMILAGDHARAPELARFKGEAEAVARLQHPNIVKIHEIGEQDGRPFFSLEFCGGGTLTAKLAGTPLPSAEAARLVETLARAMQAAHLQGIVHRDLKPANILLASGGSCVTPAAERTGGSHPPLADLVPKIADFGLAKQLDGNAGQTQTGAIMGTPSYMAPEQAEGKSKQVGPLCDVYALGAILYECLTGRPPFMADSMVDTLLQVRFDEPVPPRRLNFKVPHDLETICLKCLEKWPGKRYADAAALADDLRRFLAGEPIQARPVGRVERILKWGRRHPGAAAGIAVTVLAGVALTVSGLVYNNRLSRALEDVTEQRDKAQQARAAEREQRLRAEKGEKTAREHLYAVQMGRGTNALKTGRIDQLADLLESTRPERTGGEDLRGWEWH